jgi:hypothetical protein
MRASASTAWRQSLNCTRVNEEFLEGIAQQCVVVKVARTVLGRVLAEAGQGLHPMAFWRCSSKAVMGMLQNSVAFECYEQCYAQ